MSTLPRSNPVTSELWYIRGFANDQQEPLPRHQVFLRVDWPNILTRNVDMTAFAFVNLLDASIFAQVAALRFVGRMDS